MTDPAPRRCRSCGARLARDQTGPRCSPCEVSGRDALSESPEVPEAFWHDAQLQAALAARHLGQVIRAYRLHPRHGEPLAQEEVGAWAGLSQGQVSRIENGPALRDLDRLIAWATLLRIPGQYLWFHLPKATSVGVPASRLPAVVDDAEVLEVEFVSPDRLDRVSHLPASLAALLDGTTPTPVPAKAGTLEIAQIRNAAKFYEGWDFAYGGGIVREGVIAQLRWSAALLDAGCAPGQRDELFSAVGYLAHICAFMAFDDLASDDAKRMWRLGLACAEEAGDWPLRANVLSAMARLALWFGRHDEGLTLSELALVRADRLTRIQQAELHATKARFLAALRRRDDTLAVLEQADASFAEADRDEVPIWMTYYDDAEHAADTGHALFDLTAADHSPAPARERLSAAVEGHAHLEAFARSQALNQTKLATLVMTTGDPHEAGVLGLGALDLANGIRSKRLNAYLHELAGRARGHHGVAEVDLFHERLALLPSP